MKDAVLNNKKHFCLDMINLKKGSNIIGFTEQLKKNHAI